VTRRLEGKPVAEARFAQLRRRVEELHRSGTPSPALVSIHRASASPFSVYLRGQARGAATVGLEFRPEPLPGGMNADGLAGYMSQRGAQPDVHAVLLEHPLPEELDFQRAINQLPPEKDVDGVNSVNLGLLVAGTPIHVPAVVRAVRSILAFYEVPTSGRRVAVIGRSGTVGLPMVLSLAARGAEGDATVTLIHSKTAGLRDVLEGNHVVVSCAGRPGLLGRAEVPKGSVVVDVGLSTVPDPDRPNGVRVEGDARSDELDGWVEAFSPVPGGVGPVTVAELMGNAVRAWELSLPRSTP
jgi:methylenetetrahydrofolate dehydrogenase (NADP+) / methenyltetrahydrofolate cyclohydrolase